MGTVIAVNGKGGTGKTTVASLIVRCLVRDKKGKGVLAIDADPNSCLADALGIKAPPTIVGTCDEISKNLDKLPAGMTKDRYIEMRVQEAVVENKDFDLLVMGRPEGPGCYCYVNNLLRNMVQKITCDYDFVVIDNAAGMEHISRRTTGSVNKLVLVSDYSVVGVRSAKKIYDLARELRIKIGAAYLVMNKVSGPMDKLYEEIQKTDLGYLGQIPYDEDVIIWGVSDSSIFEFTDEMVDDAVNKIYRKLME